MKKVSQSQDLNKMAGQKQVVSSLLAYGLSTYKFGKQFTVGHLPILQKPLDFGETKAASLTSAAFARANMTPDGVITNLDNKALQLITYLDVDQKYACAKTKAATPIKIISEAKDYALKLQDRASKRVDVVISSAECLVDSYLPLGAKGPEKGVRDPKASKVTRIVNLPIDTTCRVKDRAVARMSDLCSREKSPLTRYVDLIDLQVVRERLTSSSVGSAVLNSDSYLVFKGFVVRNVREATAATCGVSQKLGKYKTEIAIAADARVLTPAKDFYAIAAAEFIKLTKNPKEELFACSASAERFATKYYASVKVALGEGWSEKLAPPTEAFLGYCKSAYKQVQVTCPQGTEKTEAFLNALRIRLSAEWTTRVQPAIQKLKAHDLVARRKGC